MQQASQVQTKLYHRAGMEQVAGRGASTTMDQHPFGITCYYQKKLAMSDEILIYILHSNCD